MADTAEIDELRQRLAAAEAALRDRDEEDASRHQAEADNRTLLDLIDEGFCIIEVIGGERGEALDYRFLETNASFERQTGLVDAVGRRMRELAPQHEEHWFERYERIARTRTPERFEDRAEALGRWYDVYAFAIGAREQRRVAILFRDVIERKRAEQALCESEANYRALFESMDEAYAVVDVLKDEAGRWADFRFVEVNRAFVDHTSMPWPVGKTATEILGTPNPQWAQLYGQALESGQAIRVEEAEPTLDRTFDVNVFALDPARNRVAVLFTNVTSRKRTEAALRESEERQAFLLKLSDALRPLADAEAIQATTTRLLGEHLGVDRAMYAEVTGERGVEAGLIRGQFIRPAASGRPAPNPFPDQFTYETFGADVMARRYSGEGLAVADVNADAGFDATERAAWASVGVQAAIVAPLVKGGRLVAELGIHSETPRVWTAAEVSLVREVGERTWAAAQRARAEEALRQSEEKFRTLFETIDSGYALTDLVRDQDGRVIDLLGVEFNRNYTRHSGLPPFAGQRATDVITVDPEWLRQYEEVTRTGLPSRHENYIQDEDRWVSTYFSLVGELGSDRVAVVFDDITERKRAEEALRESAQRQAFLLKLGDELRPLTDPAEIIDAAVRLLGEAVGASHTYFAEWPSGADYCEIRGDHAAPGLPSLVGRYPIDAFRSIFDRIGDGRTWVVDDVADGSFEPSERDYCLSHGVVAWVDVPLVKADELQAALFVVQSAPRRWTAAEVALAEETAERTWAALQRARAEAALRESEERFRQFADASADVLWIRDADLAATYVSAAAASVYGVAPGLLVGDRGLWDSLVVPEDRAVMTAQLEGALGGEVTVTEFRVLRPTDQVFRWVRRTAFPLLGPGGEVEAVAGISADVTEARLLADHQVVLLAELQHRVRNIMAIIRSMARRTSDGAADVEDYRSLLEGRLLALARVQVLLTRAANAGGSLRDIIESEVSVQAAHRGQFDLDGPDIRLSPKAVEVLTLAFHELATNALKYGALSSPNGRLRVSWFTFEKRERTWLALDWVEDGAPPRGTVTRRGFGSDLIEGRIPYELGGTGKVVIGPGGAHCHLEFPLKEGESILETDAPTPAVVFGGTLDMTNAPELTGRRVLVVEDDYYIASDTAAALRGAGADVLGPCPSQEAVLGLLEHETPTHAVLDLNLGGGGPRFEIAHLLKARGVPFVFLTGYDPDVIPPDLEEVVRLQKPVQFRSIIEAVSDL